MLVSVSKTSGVGVTNIYAMEASPGEWEIAIYVLLGGHADSYLGAPSPQALVYTDQNGGKAGIWQTGMGFPTVGNQVYFVTGYVDTSKHNNCLAH